MILPNSPIHLDGCNCKLIIIACERYFILLEGGPTSFMFGFKDTSDLVSNNPVPFMGTITIYAVYSAVDTQRASSPYWAGYHSPP